MDKNKAREKIEKEMVNIYAEQFGVKNDQEAMEVLWDVVFPGRRQVYYPDGIPVNDYVPEKRKMENCETRDWQKDRELVEALMPIVSGKD